MGRTLFHFLLVMSALAAFAVAGARFEHMHGEGEADHHHHAAACGDHHAPTPGPHQHKHSHSLLQVAVFGHNDENHCCQEECDPPLVVFLGVAGDTSGKVKQVLVSWTPPPGDSWILPDRVPAAALDGSHPPTARGECLDAEGLRFTRLLI